jgi:hypothetical protein
MLASNMTPSVILILPTVLQASLPQRAPPTWQVKYTTDLAASSILCGRAGCRWKQFCGCSAGVIPEGSEATIWAVVYMAYCMESGLTVWLYKSDLRNARMKVVSQVLWEKVCWPIVVIPTGT